MSRTLPLPVRILRSMRVFGLALISCLLLQGCNSSSDIAPSPIPANALAGAANARNAPASTGLAAEARGTRLDRLLAVVEGKHLTMRMMVRRLGINASEIDDPDNQVEIQRETLGWAKERLYEKAAERIGLKLPAARVDVFAEQRLTQELERASEEVGRPVTRQEFLGTEKLNWAEFREQQRGILVRQLYVKKLLVGLGKGTRPQVDMVVSPAEVRRIYRANPGLFDEQAGVRLAQFRVAFEEEEGREFGEVEQVAKQQAARLANDFQSGMTAEDIARKYDLGEPGEGWRPAAEGQFATRAPDPAVSAWMLAPGRKPGDYRVGRLPTGMQVLGIVEIRAARRVPYKEAYAGIVKELAFARQAQLEARTTIDLLSGGNVVWPDELADLLVEQSRGVLDKIQEIDHLRGARLR